MKKQKGITLVALIITIVVIMILVAVSVTVALQSGLFSATSKAASDTRAAAEKENELAAGKITVGETPYNSMKEYIDSLGGAGSSVVALPEDLGVGDIITGYVPASNYTLSNKYDVSTAYAGCTGTFYTDMGSSVEWKVIEVIGNTMKIIPKAVSTTNITLSGANGWNNGINAINGVCGAIYGNTESKLYTATATGLTIEEINKIAGYTPAESPASYSPSQYESNNKFPIEYLKENGIIDYTGETDGYAKSTSTDKFIKDTYYDYTAESQTNFNNKFAGWIESDGNYWLASRSVISYSTSASFNVRFVNSDGYVVYNWVFDSDGNSLDMDFAVRPVVSLTSKVEPIYVKTVGEGEEAINYWKFE